MLDPIEMVGASEQRYWETKTLPEMSQKEWEALCDGCGKCCMIKAEDEDTGEFFETRIHCQLFDPKTCRCADYSNRTKRVKDCLVLTPETVGELAWLPETCAYVRVYKGLPLPDWHHLVCGDPRRIFDEGMGAQYADVNERDIDLHDIEDYLL